MSQSKSATSSVKSLLRNLRMILARDIEGRLVELQDRLERRADQFEQSIDLRLDARLSGIEKRLDERIGELTSRLEKGESESRQRLEELASLMSRMETSLEDRMRSLRDEINQQEAELSHRIESRLDVWMQTNDRQIEERMLANDRQIEERMLANDRQIDERMGVIDLRIDQRLESIESGSDLRFSQLEQRVETRFGDIEGQLARRAGEYEAAIDQRVDLRFAAVEAQAAQNFSEHSRAVDIRLDDRQVGMDRRIDERFSGLEERTDTRMEAHELRIDRTLEQNRNDIIERTDLLLQVFDRRLDQQRRSLAGGSDATPPGALGRPNSESHRDLRSGHRQGGVTIYNEIMSWKEEAESGLDKFTADEQEVVDYLLSFIAEPDAQSYVRQHMRRYLGTLHRIPPAQRSGDAVLELGSLTPLAPAIRRFCGYQQIIGNNWWPGDEKLKEKTFERTDGGEQLSIPLHNFNVEVDQFPFADRSFRVILCGELLEHLQRDPLHMLWECNRVLEDDGQLILTTPNIAGCRSLEGILTGCSPYLFSQYNLESSFDQHHREYAPQEVSEALKAAGFEVLKLETEDVWRRSNPAILELLSSCGVSTELRGDNIFVIARKAGPPVDRYPRTLYID